MPLIVVVYQCVKHIGFYAAFDLRLDGIGLIFNASIYPCRSRYIPKSAQVGWLAALLSVAVTLLRPHGAAHQTLF